MAICSHSSIGICVAFEASQNLDGQGLFLAKSDRQQSGQRSPKNPRFHGVVILKMASLKLTPFQVKTSWLAPLSRFTGNQCQSCTNDAHLSRPGVRTLMDNMMYLPRTNKWHDLGKWQKIVSFGKERKSEDWFYNRLQTSFSFLVLFNKNDFSSSRHFPSIFKLSDLSDTCVFSKFESFPPKFKIVFFKEIVVQSHN